MVDRCEFTTLDNIDGDLVYTRCPADAVWSVGARGQHHLCDAHAGLPAFARYTTRRPVLGTLRPKAQSDRAALIDRTGSLSTIPTPEVLSI